MKCVKNKATNSITRVKDSVAFQFVHRDKSHEYTSKSAYKKQLLGGD